MCNFKLDFVVKINPILHTIINEDFEEIMRKNSFEQFAPFRENIDSENIEVNLSS